ncbi:MAG TPA: hypothetical protein VL463_36920 [Kofleriaceae bacterium]|nr:hypothetical protein [Kofleriaceae bacterium]
MKTFDLILRFLYCVFVPIAIGGFALVVPVGGILVGAAIGTIVAVLGTDRWRAATARIPLVGRALGKMTRLGDYYREHPPRHVVYYIFYPLLFPYWLFVKRARGEFRLYRHINALALLVLIVAGLTDYLQHWPPELGPNEFFSAGVATFVLQTILTMSAIMPLVTTVIVFHHEHRRRLLIALAICGGITALSSVGLVVHNTQLSQTTEYRLRKRAEAVPARRDAALDHAVAAARAALRDDTKPGMVEGAPLDAARAALEDLWKPDETRGFRVWWSGPPMRVVVVFATIRHRDPIWSASGVSEKIPTIDRLPREAQAELRSTR